MKKTTNDWKLSTSKKGKKKPGKAADSVTAQVFFDEQSFNSAEIASLNESSFLKHVQEVLSKLFQNLEEKAVE